MEEAPGNQELLWYLELVVRQSTVLQEGAAQLARISSSENLKMPRPTQVKEMNGALISTMIELCYCVHCVYIPQVERRSGLDLSYKEFFTQYALTHTPVVITDIVDQMGTHPWTFDYIREVAI